MRLKAFFAFLVVSAIVLKFQACSDVAFSPAETDLGSLSYVGDDVIEKVLIQPDTKSEAVPFNLVLVLDESRSMQPYLDRFNNGLRDLLNGLKNRNVNVEVYFSRDPKSCHTLEANLHPEGLKRRICSVEAPVAQLDISEHESNFDQKVNNFYQVLSGLLDQARNNASTRDTNPYSSCTVLRRLHKAYKEKAQGAFSFVVITDENDAAQMRNCYAEYLNKRDAISQTKVWRLRFQSMVMKYDYAATGEGGATIRRSSSRGVTQSSDWSNGSSCSTADIQRSFSSSTHVYSCTYSTHSYTTSIDGSLCQSLEANRSQLMSRYKTMVPGSSLSCYDTTSTSYESVDRYLAFSSSIQYDTRGPQSLRSYSITDEFTNLARNYGMQKVFLAPIIITDRSQIRNSDQEVGSKYIELGQNIVNRSIASIADQDYGQVLQPLETFAKRFFARSYQLNSKFYPTLVGTQLAEVKARYADGSEKTIQGVSYQDGRLAFDNSDDLDGASWLEVKVVHPGFNSSSPQ